MTDEADGRAGQFCWAFDRHTWRQSGSAHRPCAPSSHPAADPGHPRRPQAVCGTGTGVGWRWLYTSTNDFVYG